MAKSGQANDSSGTRAGRFAIDRHGVLPTLSGVLRVKLNRESEERCGSSQHITSVP